jgi:hypothetical protein
MEIKKEIYYFIMILNNIAKRYLINIYEVYEYLARYKGIEFLSEFYDVEHTLNTEDVIEDVLTICSDNGGVLQ